jgi:nitrite reductase/ring-hydroxylating ferredoxin subunit
MFSKLKVKAAALLIAVLAVTVAGCSPGDPEYPTIGLEKIKATWVTADLTAASVSVPVQAVDQNTIIHFWMKVPEGDMPFMAYELEGKTYVRANVCVPCRSYNFSLEGDELVCDTCGTRFSAVTGEGISGACKAYPKASVEFTTEGGKLVMAVDDAKTAYAATLEPGLP